MAVIADLCPQCGRVTRCLVVERVSVVGGLIFGIPFVLPASSVNCRCGECGTDFRSKFWDHQRSVLPAEAASLDTRAILTLTNPALQQRLVLAELTADPALTEAFALLDRLRPGRLRIGLADALNQWPGLDERQRERFLDRVRRCSQALEFARSMAGRYSTGAVGCLAGAVVCAGVWVGWLGLLGTADSASGWVGFLAVGALPGGILAQSLWSRRDRNWVKAVLIPEATRAGIDPGWLLAVLEGGSESYRGDDELRALRPIASAVRAELHRSGDAPKESDVGFGT